MGCAEPLVRTALLQPENLISTQKEIPDMKVLVTGGSGFIGSHVVDKLREKDIAVRVFDMVMPTFRKDIEFYHGSLLDFEAVKMAMNGIDAVFHLAAIADVNDIYEEPHYGESINVGGTINVLEAARKAK